MTVAIVATLGAWLSFAAGGGPARAYMCPPTYSPYLEVAWADGGTGFVASRRAVLMFAMDGDCKYRYTVPPDELLVSAARKAEGPFDPVAIERRGKLFAWRPPEAGLWYLRVDRKPNGLPARAGAGAIVVAYESEARVNARLTLSLDGKLQGRIALQPVVEPGNLMPYLLLPRPTASGVIAMRLPRGRYLARDSFVDRRSQTDDRSGALRRVEISSFPTGQSGMLDVVGDGDALLRMHAVERLPRPHAD